MSVAQEFSKGLVREIVARKTIGTDQVESEIPTAQLKHTEACNLFSNPLLVRVWDKESGRGNPNVTNSLDPTVKILVRMSAED
jgi:hypothetical protein